MLNLFKATQQNRIRNNVYIGTKSDIARKLHVSSPMYIKDGALINGFKIELLKGSK